MDETILSLHPPLSKCWMKRGQQKRVPTPGEQERCYVFGAYDWHSDQVTWTTAEHPDSLAFSLFLEHLLVDRYPNERVILVLDNASYHRSSFSMSALSLFEGRALIFWLPPYCSTELNPIERYWRHLKDTACVNTLYPSLPALTAAVERQLELQNDENNSHRFVFSKE